MSPGPRVGLVLGAGGATGGAFHAAVLSVLAEELGWDARTAEVIVGTSAGSLTGAILRAGLPPADLAARSLGRPLSAEGSRVLAGAGPPPTGFPLRPAAANVRPRRSGNTAVLARAAMRPWAVRPIALLASLMPPGQIPTAMITDGLAPIFGSTWPAGTLWINAVRLSDSRRVVFGRGEHDRPPLGLAVAASCAIPGFFEPVTIGSTRYIDGGAHSPTNLDLVAGLGLDLVIVSSPMSAAGRAIPLSPGGAVRRACRVMLDAEAVGVRRRGTPVVAFQPTADDQEIMGINAMDFRRRGAVTERVRESTRRRLQRDDIRERLRVLTA